MLQEVRQQVEDEAPRLVVEGDIEFVAPDIEDQTNAMIVGPSQRGPAFIPTTIRTPEQFEAVFGEAETYSSYSAQKVLERTDRVNFTRVLSADGWDPTPIGLFGPAGTDFPHFETGLDPLLAILILDDRYQRVTGADPALSEIVSSEENQRATAEDFVLRTFRPDIPDENGDDELSPKEQLLQDDGLTEQEETPKELVDEFRLSLNPRSGRYVTKILPPQVRVYQNFPESQREIVTEADETVFITPVVFDEDAVENPLSIDTFSTPRTPWVLSQLLTGDERLKLFRFWVRSDSEDENRRFKISISEIGDFRSESGWPTFNVKLRDFDDTDINQNIIEEFPRLSLNPEDERFIGRQIGTRVRDFDDGRIETSGAFEAQSLNIRVELGPGIQRATRDVVPFGFSSYKRTFSTSSQVPVYRTEQNFGQLTDYLEAQRTETDPGRGVSFTEDLHLGIEFRADQNNNIFLPIPENTQDMDEGFVLDSRPGGSLPQASAGLDPFESDVSERKFSFGFQGGSEGQSPFREEFSGTNIEKGNTFGFSFENSQSGGRIAYQRAFDLLREVEAGFEFNLLTTPELDFQNHNTTIREAEELIRERGDALYVYDSFELGTSPEEAFGQIQQLDSSFAATYYGWVREGETEFDFVPPSAVIPQTYVLSDNQAAPWFAPSGNQRGLVPDVLDVEFRLTQDQLDRFYDRNINSITFFDDDGVLLWGNRTTFLQRESLLSSINIRRLLAFIISGVRDITEDFVFEANNPETAQAVRSQVSELLSTVQNQSGVSRWEIEIDVPQDAREFQNRPHLFNMTVSIVPRSATEFIDLNFTVEQERFVVNV